MTKLENSIELAKVLIAYCAVGLALVSPFGLSIWAGFQVGKYADSHIVGVMSATTLAVPGLLIGLHLARFVGYIFMSTWGRRHE